MVIVRKIQIPVWFARSLCALATLAAAIVPAGALAQNEANALATNKGLTPNQMLRSSNKQYKAIMQGDGNFVVYREPWTAIWATGTNGRGAVTGVWMQGDGNLCVNGPQAALWCNYSNGPSGSYFLLLRDNGDLEVYRGTPAAAASAQLIWTSVLDAAYYAGRYADLRGAFGSDTRKLMAHWLAYGRFEGRSPKNGISDEGRQHAQSVSLDTQFYANKYPDLRQAFGYDAERLYQHWMTYGRPEGRVPNKATDDFLAPAPRSAHLQDVMRVGDWLRQGERMVSRSGRFRLDLQPDAQFVIYEGNPAPNTRRWWQNDRGFPLGNYFAILQEDGHICTYAGTGPSDNRGFIGCSPQGAGGPKGRYFAALQDDGNLAIYKGSGPYDQRGWIWDRITTRPSQGFNFGAVAEAVKVFVVSTANTVASGTVQTANTVASGTTQAANAIGNEVVKTATKTVNDIVNTANLVADTTEKVAVQAGSEIEAGGKVIGNEIVKDGKIVGYAVAKVATDAWNFLNANCGRIGRTAFPLPATGYFRGVDQLSGIFASSGVVDPATRSAFKDVNSVNAAAGQCFEQIQDGFYCAIPKEMASLVVEAGQIPGNLLNLSTRVFNEAKTEQCLIVGASTAMFGALGLEVCAFGKVVVQDAQKAIACFTAAESKGVMAEFLTPGAARHAWPSKESCEGVGVLALSTAKAILSNGLSAEAKAATKAGKSNTVAQVASELKKVYSVIAAGARYDAIVSKLEALPECRN